MKVHHSSRGFTLGTSINIKSTFLFQDAIDKWLEVADFDSDGRISIEEFKLSIAGNSLVDELDEI